MSIWQDVYFEFPSNNTILMSSKKIHVLSEFCTVEHNAKKLIWTCTSWGKFTKRPSLFVIDLKVI